MAICLATLAVVVGALALANTLQGPRLRSVDVNPAALVDRAGGRIVLHANQRLATGSATGATITPEAPVTASVDGSSLDLQIGRMLDYGTTYTVHIPQAVSVYTANHSSLEYTFTTPDAALYTLLRDPRIGDDGIKLDDSIRRESLDPAVEAETVFTAERIQEYAALPSVLAMVVLAADTSASVVVTDLDGGSAHSVLLPGLGSVRQLSGSGRSELLGFSYTGSSSSADVENVLMVYDPSDRSGVARAVVGLDGEALQVMDWTFVPGTTSIVAQAYDQSLYLVDALTATAQVALGQHGELRGFIPGTSDLIVADPLGDAMIDLTEGSVTPLTPPAPDEGLGTYPGPLVYLDSALSTAQLFTTPTGQPGQSLFASAIAVTDMSGSRIVYEPALEGTRIRDFCVSPNGQYLAIETGSADGGIDDYPSVAAYAGMSTVIVDIATGETTRTLYGFLPGWCR